MNTDSVDDLLRQWATARPQMDAAALGIVVRIELLARLLNRRANRALQQHSLKHWEYDVLSALRRQGAPFEMPATDIARDVHLTSGAMTTRIDRLEERGLVARRPDSRDGRAVLVRLTAAGLALASRAIDTRIADAEAVMASVPPDERRQLTACLRGMLLAEIS